MGNIEDWHDMYPLFVTDDTECLMQPKLPYPVFLIKFRQCGLHFLRRMILREFHRQITDSPAYAGIVNLAALLTAVIRKHQGKAMCLQAFHHTGKIIIIKFLKNNNVMEHRLIDCPFYLSPDFAGHAVAVFIVDQQIGQIAMP